jgi:hypothetical protein
MMACVKPETSENPADKWNGYSIFLKTGEMVHTLWAGKNINIGTVTYGLDENANFYVTYNVTASGWKIAETHLYAGDKANMPLNRPGRPKIGLFPYHHEHHPKVTTFTYRIPLTSLPPCASPGFIVAAHAIVYHPGHYKCGQTESAWAEGNYTFSDKGWGWYDSYYYDPPQEPLPVLYGTSYSNDSLRLYHLDITSGIAELMLVEYVGNSPGTYDGAAYDIESGIFFFTKYNTGELWFNQLQGDDPSFCAGTLNGIAASGTFYDQAYYYVDENLNTINEVTFNSDWMISGETVLDTIPGLVSVNDIAMSPAGDFLVILGHYDGAAAELITWDVSDEIFYSSAIAISEGAQITFGSDGQLYALAPADDGSESNFVYTVDLECATLMVIEDIVITIEDPFTDISGGPAQ